MTPFGNRDFERDPAGEQVEYGWEHDDALAQLLDEQPPALPLTRDTRRVIVRLTDGEELELGRMEGREPALGMAREMVQSIGDAEAAGEWPLVGDRFLRPGAIISVDVQRAG